VKRKKLATILVAASKGGSGKTTLAVHLAVLASRSRSVVLVDLDDQGSSASWWKRRKAEIPPLVEADPHQLDRVQEEAIRRGVEILVGDCAPRGDVLPIAKLSTFVVVPSRPGPLDIDAIGRSVSEVAKSKTPGAIVLNACPPGRGSREATIVQEARQALAGAPLQVAPVSIGLRASLSHALIQGQSVHEFEPLGKAAGEIESLWNWILKEIER
jgi:chromosome partitioning protein